MPDQPKVFFEGVFHFHVPKGQEVRFFRKLVDAQKSFENEIGRPCSPFGEPGMMGTKILQFDKEGFLLNSSDVYEEK